MRAIIDPAVVDGGGVITPLPARGPWPWVLAFLAVAIVVAGGLVFSGVWS